MSGLLRRTMSDNRRTIFALRGVGYRMLEAADWLEEEQVELKESYAQILRVKMGIVNEHL